MSSIQILTKFKTQLVTFFDELVSQFPMEGDLVVARLFIDTQLPIQEAMNVFLHKINKNNGELKKMVKNRDEGFLEYNIFEGISKGKINHFKKLWKSNNLDQDDKQIIWQWVDTFIFLADKYSKTLE